MECITKIDGPTLDDGEDLDLFIPMFNLLEYIRNILTQQVVYGFIQKMKQLTLILILRTMLLLSLSSIKLN